MREGLIGLNSIELTLNPSCTTSEEMHPWPSLSLLVLTIVFTSQIVTVPSCIPPATIPISPVKELHPILEKLLGAFA